MKIGDKMIISENPRMERAPACTITGFRRGLKSQPEELNDSRALFFRIRSSRLRFYRLTGASG